MDMEMAKSSQINDAYRQIKTDTGISDVQQMVKNFLSRESTYSSLLTNVNDSETRMEKLKNDNVELSERLHELKVNAAGAEEDGDKAGERFQDEELVEMRKHIAN
jgi:septation ring formation regulator EzrA